MTLPAWLPVALVYFALAAYLFRLAAATWASGGFDLLD